MVAPDLQGAGLGRSLLAAIEAEAPAEATSYALFTGARSLRNQRMYKRAAGSRPGVGRGSHGFDAGASAARRSCRDLDLPASSRPDFKLTRPSAVIRPDLWQTGPSAQSAEGSPRLTAEGPASGTCHRGR